MPSKRKRADQQTESTPKRRSTRSTTIKKNTSQGADDANHPSRGQPRKQLQVDEAHEVPQKASAVSKDHENFEITDDSMKKPIQCHRYPGPPASPTHELFIYTHGAGGTLDSPAAHDFCVGYGRQAPLVAFQGNMNLKARVKGFHTCDRYLRKDTQRTGRPTIRFGGRSMGARAAVIAASEMMVGRKGENAEGNHSMPPTIELVLVSYPLKGPKDDIRDQILLDLPESARVLFIIGSKDSMCPLDLLSEVRKKMNAKSALLVIRNADHGVHVYGGKGKATEEVGIATGILAAKYWKFEKSQHGEEKELWWEDGEGVQWDGEVSIIKSITIN